MILKLWKPNENRHNGVSIGNGAVVCVDKCILWPLSACLDFDDDVSRCSLVDGEYEMLAKIPVLT